MYTAVVRTIVTHTATVWWHRVKLRTCRAELSEFQRMACFGITGAMTIVSTVAVEILLGLPHCTSSWKLRPEQEFIDSTAITNENPNLKVLDMHTRLRE